jgi:hypothetical protein
LDYSLLIVVSWPLNPLPEKPQWAKLQETKTNSSLIKTIFIDNQKYKKKTEERKGKMAELWGNSWLYLDILDTSLCFHCEVKWFGQVKNLIVDSLNLFDISSTYYLLRNKSGDCPSNRKKSLEKGRDVEIACSHWKRPTQIWRTSPLDLCHFDTGQSEKVSNRVSRSWRVME